MKSSPMEFLELIFFESQLNWTEIFPPATLDLDLQNSYNRLNRFNVEPVLKTEKAVTI